MACSARPRGMAAGAAGGNVAGAVGGQAGLAAAGGGRGRRRPRSRMTQKIAMIRLGHSEDDEAVRHRFVAIHACVDQNIPIHFGADLRPSHQAGRIRFTSRASRCSRPTDTSRRSTSTWRRATRVSRWSRTRAQVQEHRHHLLEDGWLEHNIPMPPFIYAAPKDPTRVPAPSVLEMSNSRRGGLPAHRSRVERSDHSARPCPFPSPGRSSSTAWTWEIKNDKRDKKKADKDKAELEAKGGSAEGEQGIFRRRQDGSKRRQGQRASLQARRPDPPGQRAADQAAA